MKRAISEFISFLIICFFIGVDAGILQIAINTELKWLTIVMSMLFTVLLTVTFFVVWLLQEVHKYVMKDDK